MLGLQCNFRSKVQIYIDKIKSNAPLFNGLLLTPDELNTIKQAFASTTSESTKIKKGIHSRYSVIKDNNGKYYAIYTGAEGAVASGAQGLIKVAQNLETGKFLLVKISKSKNLASKFHPIEDARKEEIFVKKRGYFAGSQERESHQFPLKHYTFMDTLPGITAEEMFSYLFRNNIELTDFQQIELLIQFYEALLILQSEKIIHRDLTPTNILISPEDLTVRFVDFGLALEAGNDGTVFDYLPIDTKKEKGMIQYANGIDVKKMYGIVLMFVTNEDLQQLVEPEYLGTFSFDQTRISEKYPKGRIQYHQIDIESVLCTLKARKKNMLDSSKSKL